MNNKRLFISYAREDMEFAQQLANLLSQQGASVSGSASLQPGMFWPDVVRNEIQNASALILVIPSQFVHDRNNIWFEAGAARAFGKKVLAVLPPGPQTDRKLPTTIADLLVLDADMRPLDNVASVLLQAA